MNYQDSKLSEARTAAAKLCLIEGIDSLYLSGSLLANLGTPTSDVDVFVLLADGHTPADDTVQMRAGSERLDVEYYTLGYVRDVISQVTDWTLTNATMKPVWIPERDLDFAVRLTHGEVLKDSPALAGFREQLSTHRSKLRQLLIARWAVEANNFLEDLEGAFLEYDLDSAALIGQSLMTVAGKAVAAAGDDLYFGRKWVSRQLRRSAGAAFPYEKFARYQRGEWIAEGATGYADFRFLVQTCLIAAASVGWHQPSIDRWTSWHAQDSRLQRNAEFNPIRLTEGLVLNQERRRQFVIKPEVALIWGLCDGAPSEQVVQTAVALLDCDPEFQHLDEHRCETILDALAAKNLISPA